MIVVVHAVDLAPIRLWVRHATIILHHDPWARQRIVDNGYLVVHDEVTVIDNALTRPWVVMKNYRRVADPQPYWREVNCMDNNNHVEIGQQNYMLSADGLLMPTKKDQPPPDLRYFNQSRK